MSRPTVRIEGIGKRYRLGEGRRAYDTLRDQLARVLNEFRRGGSPRADQWFWALKDVSLEVTPGETVAIIGRNGTGKSTLLQILAGITVPTEGRAELDGQVASLLEVGTGFHPELTGRENIHVNGALLGMTAAGIKRRFDEIVAFAELERFIDTPVKSYSSGMWLRLAFAIAAHLEPEILLIDEVLAVGDAAFQRKCLGKMDDVHRAGRTVLFVSHDIPTVTTLATRAVWLDAGRVADAGPARDVVKRYLESVPSGILRGERNLIPADEFPIVVTAISTADAQGRPTSIALRSEGLIVTVEGEVRAPLDEPDEYYVAISVDNQADVNLFWTYNIEHREVATIPRAPGRFVLRCCLPPDLLPTGTYRLGIATGIAGRALFQWVAPALEFDIIQDGLLAGVWATTWGLLTPSCEWARLPARDAPTFFGSDARRSNALETVEPPGPDGTGRTLVTRGRAGALS